MNTIQDKPPATATCTDTPLTGNPAADPLLVDKPWQLCGISRAHWCRLEVAGKTPLAIRLGRKKLYRQRDLALWVEWGCPPRSELEARLATMSRRIFQKMVPG